MKNAFMGSLFFLLTLIGLGDSLYLTWDHASYQANPMAFSGGLCGAEGGCIVSRASALSEFPIPGSDIGLPTSLLGLGFYVAFLLLLLLWRRQEKVQQESQKTRHLLFGLSFLATLYSLILLAYSISFGSICQFCAILYVVNPLLLFLSYKHLRSPFSGFLKGLPKTLFSAPALLSLVGMLATIALIFPAYSQHIENEQAASKASMKDLEPSNMTPNRPQKGNLNAPIQIVEFADFECPHCQLGFQTLEDFFKDYEGQVHIQFKHFPLDQSCNPLITHPFHQHACDYALWSECAHEQGYFWEAATVIFKHHKEPKAILSHLKAAIPELDMEALKACKDSPETLKALNQDVSLGLERKLRGTPAIYLNGIQIGGAVERSDLERQVQAILKATNESP